MAIDWRHAVVLWAAELDAAWELLDLGRTPAVLELPRPGRTPTERDRVVGDAVRALRDRALARGTTPGPRLAADLATLARAETVRDLVVTAPRRYAALAATAGGSCVLAARLDDRVALARIAPGRAAAELVGLLGPIRAGRGPAVRIPAGALAGAVAACHGPGWPGGPDHPDGPDRPGGPGPDRFASQLLRHGLDGRQAQAVLRMSRLVGAGQLGAELRTPSGPLRAPYPLLLHVTADGFYRQRRVPRAGADPVVEAGPVDAAALVRELEELVRAAGAAHRRGAGRGSTRPAAAGGIGSVTGAHTS